MIPATCKMDMEALYCNRGDEMDSTGMRMVRMALRALRVHVLKGPLQGGKKRKKQ